MSFTHHITTHTNIYWCILVTKSLQKDMQTYHSRKPHVCVVMTCLATFCIPYTNEDFFHFFFSFGIQNANMKRVNDMSLQKKQKQNARIISLDVSRRQA